MPKRREAASWARRRRSLALAKVIIRPCQRLTPLHAKEQGSACRGDSLVGGVGQSRGPSEDDREHHSVFSDRPDAVRRLRACDSARPCLYARRAAHSPGRYRGCRAASETRRWEEHTSELQSLMRNSYAVFGLTQKKNEHHT